MRKMCAVAALLVLTACGGKQPASSIPASKTHAYAGLTREAWLQTAKEWIETPSKIPRLNQQSTRPAFEAFASSSSWLDPKWNTFASEENAELSFRVPQAFKALILVLEEKRAIDEILLLNMYSFLITQKIIKDGEAFINAQGGSNAQRAARLKGLKQVRHGAAISFCPLFASAAAASPPYQKRAREILLSRETYTEFDHEGLQLIAATLAKPPWSSPGTSFHKELQDTRSLILKIRQKRPGIDTFPKTTYAGFDRESFREKEQRDVVSRSGGFSVLTRPAAVEKTVQEAANAPLQHWLEFQKGETLFSAVCFDQISTKKLAQSFAKLPSLVRRKGGAPGRWFKSNTNEKRADIRILTLDGRACMAAVEGPTGATTDAEVELFLLSLRSTR